MSTDLYALNKFRCLCVFLFHSRLVFSLFIYLFVFSSRHVVLDEADRMLEMGFQEKVEQILKNAYLEGNRNACDNIPFCFNRPQSEVTCRLLFQ